MSRRLAGLGLLPFVFCIGSSNACEPGFFAETYENHGSVAWQQAGPACVLDASLTAADLTAAAVIHVRRREPAAPFRMSFRADLSELDGLNLIQSVSIAGGVARNAAPSGTDEAVADLFRLLVFGTGGGKILGIVAACSSGAGNRCVTTVQLPSNQPTIGLELDVGSGSDGELRYWIDTAFDQQPTGVLADLDNAVWAGIERIVLGASSATQPFLSGHLGTSIRFDQVNLGEDGTFWDDFELNATADCGAEALPIPTHTTVVGSTCDGSLFLPSLASGSSAIPGSPERIYQYNVSSDNYLLTALPDQSEMPVAAYVCPRTCGPTTRCIAAATSSGAMPLALPAGEHLIVVKAAVPNACTGYTLEIDGPLDD